jgi:hypothetical protein
MACESTKPDICEQCTRCPPRKLTIKTVTDDAYEKEFPIAFKVLWVDMNKLKERHVDNQKESG